MTFDKNSPYNQLPPLPPLVDIETKSILKKAIAANRELAGMVNSCKRLPNQGVLYNLIFLKEAKDSSEVENIITTNDELYEAFSSEKTIFDPNTKEVLHYVDALWKETEQILKDGLLTTKNFINIVNTIKENTAGIRVSPGVKIVNAKTKEVIYTPPEGKDIILEKLKNLEEFINQKDDIDHLIKMAIIHYQFESIHPFSDGNGRTGRIINLLYLTLTGRLEHPVLFLSKYILDSKDQYYIKLRKVTEEGDWDGWIQYMLEGIEKTAIYTKEKIDGIINLFDETKNIIKEKKRKIYSKDLVEAIFKQPYCKIKFIVDAGIAQRLTASRYLKELEEIGILSSKKIGKEKLYINVKFYNLLKN
jgi:Fic family protein